MRILGFSEKRSKLKQPKFTTFRFTRRDRDWEVGELVQVVYKPRSKDREILGTAEIISKEPRFIFPQGRHPSAVVTKAEAIEDGFISWGDMSIWLSKAYGHQRLIDEPMNKLTLRWVK